MKNLKFVPMVILLGLFLAACGGGSGSSSNEATGDVSSVTVESTTVDESSDFTPTITAAADEDGSLEFTVDEIDVDGDGETEVPEISSVTATEYSGASISPKSMELKTTTWQFECKDKGVSAATSLVADDLHEVFLMDTSGYDGYTETRVRKVDCAVACESFDEDRGTFLYTLILVAVAHNYTYQSIVNMIIFLMLTC